MSAWPYCLPRILCYQQPTELYPRNQPFTLGRHKIVAITGATSGIGLALADAYARQGWAVAINGRNALHLAEAEHALRAHGHPVLGYSGDVAIAGTSEGFAAACAATLGPADVVICNAGISMHAAFADVDVAVLHRLMEVNFFGTVHTAKAFLPQLHATKGSLVGISSIAGYRGLPARTGYSASKAAMQGFFEALRTELLHSGIHVLVACPGFTASNIRFAALTANGTPQGHSPLPEDAIMPASTVATAIIGAIAARKRDLILTRQGKLTVWLNKLWPSLADRLVYNHFEREVNS